MWRGVERLREVWRGVETLWRVALPSEGPRWSYSKSGNTSIKHYDVFLHVLNRNILKFPLFVLGGPEGAFTIL